MTDETSEEHMARLRAESTTSPAQQREHRDMMQAAEAAAREKLGPIEDRRISRTSGLSPTTSVSSDQRPTRGRPPTRRSSSEHAESAEPAP